MSAITMPRLSDTMEEGTLSHWLVKPGDEVHRGDVIAQIETDKATMDLEAYDSGTLEQLLLQEGETAPIGTPVAILSSGKGGSPADTPSTLQNQERSGEGTLRGQKSAGAAAPSRDDSLTSNGHNPAPGSTPRQRVPTSPLARALARKHAIDISSLSGTGPGGRVIRADIEKAIAARPTQLADQALSPIPGDKAAKNELVTFEVPLSSLRRTTAKRLTQAASVPHFELTALVDAERLVEMRKELNESLTDPAQKVSLNDMVVKACAKALLAKPELNASWMDAKLFRHQNINIGIAVSVADGLVVPVVRSVDSLGILEIAMETRRLAEKARGGGLELGEMSDATFTISNLGPYGIEQFSAVINPPQAAILAVGSAIPRPVVRNGEVVARVSMYLTLSVDHRVQDGAGAAEFLQELTGILENPLRIVT